MGSPKKEKPVCRTCGSDDVKADAYAAWDVDTQDWQVADVYDKGAWCAACEDECRLEWTAA